MSGSSSMTRIRPLLALDGIRLFRLERQLRGERRSLAGAALHGDVSSDGFDDALRDPQSQAEAAVFARAAGAFEPLEDPLLVVGRDADALIDDADDGEGTFLARFHLDRL